MVATTSSFSGRSARSKVAPSRDRGRHGKRQSGGAPGPHLPRDGRRRFGPDDDPVQARSRRRFRRIHGQLRQSADRAGAVVRAARAPRPRLQSPERPARLPRPSPKLRPRARRSPGDDAQLRDGRRDRYGKLQRLSLGTPPHPPASRPPANSRTRSRRGRGKHHEGRAPIPSPCRNVWPPGRRRPCPALFASSPLIARRNLVSFSRRLAPFPCHDAVESRPVSASPPVREIAGCAENGGLLGDGGGNELIQARAFFSSELFGLGLDRLRQPQGVVRDGRFHGAMILANASLGRSISIPNLCAPETKSRRLNVTIASARPFAAASSTSSSPGSR